MEHRHGAFCERERKTTRCRDMDLLGKTPVMLMGKLVGMKVKTVLE